MEIKRSPMNAPEKRGTTAALYSLLALLITAALAAGCGGGGGGGGTGVTPTTPTTDTTTGVNVDTAVTALNNSDYQTAKTQLNQVVTNPAATPVDKTVAYSGLGWANIKSSADPLDVSNAISSFDQAIKSAESAGSSADAGLAKKQAYVGLASARVIENGGTAVNDALASLESAGFSNIDQTYAEGKIVTGVTSAEIRGFKTFLHYVRNQSGDATAANDNYAKLQSFLSAGSDANAQRMADTLKAMGF